MASVEEMDKARDEMVEAVSNYLRVAGAADDDQYVAGLLVSLRLVSLNDNTEQYRCTTVHSSVAEAEGLASFASTHFASLMHKGDGS